LVVGFASGLQISLGVAVVFLTKECCGTLDNVLLRIAAHRLLEDRVDRVA
jgi:hypothetical protein